MTFGVSTNTWVSLGFAVFLRFIRKKKSDFSMVLKRGIRTIEVILKNSDKIEGICQHMHLQINVMNTNMDKALFKYFSYFHCFSITKYWIILKLFSSLISGFCVSLTYRAEHAFLLRMSEYVFRMLD